MPCIPMKRHDWLAVKHCGILISLGCFLLLLSRSLSKSLSSFLPHLAAWLRRPKTLPRRLNTLNPGLRPWPPRTPRSARSASPPSRVGAVQFDPLITVVTIPSIAELPAEKRGALHRGGAVKGLQWVKDECRFGVCRFGSFVFSRCCWVLKIPKFRILLETSSEKP